MLASSIAVFASLVIGDPVTLVFGPLELAALGAAAIASAQVARGGDTNWMEGLQLLVIYFMVGVAFWLLG
jgi:Ca2+:H+ antiporter